MANILGTNNNDQLYGAASADSIYGYAGHDVLRGGLGADQLNGSSDIETASYQWWSLNRFQQPTPARATASGTRLQTSLFR
jgi:hypothetical protein